MAAHLKELRSVYRGLPLMAVECVLLRMRVGFAHQGGCRWLVVLSAGSECPLVVHLVCAVGLLWVGLGCCSCLLPGFAFKL